MRIGTWNCRGAFASHGAAALAELQPDVLVVPEARGLSGEGHEEWTFHHRPYLNKGTGVFVRRGWGVEVLEPPDGVARDWLLPLRIRPTGPPRTEFVLLGFWALSSRAPRLPSYIAQFEQLLQSWSPVIEQEPTVIAGDFNASGRSPGHLRNVATADALQLASAYHLHHGVEHGGEPDMTLKWIGKGSVEFRYHCDFVFVPRRWSEAISEVEVGSWETWVCSGRSDHAPVMVELRGLGNA